jgi:hypothetical protein
VLPSQYRQEPVQNVATSNKTSGGAMMQFRTNDRPHDLTNDLVKSANCCVAVK